MIHLKKCNSSNRCRSVYGTDIQNILFQTSADFISTRFTILNLSGVEQVIRVYIIHKHNIPSTRDSRKTYEEKRAASVPGIKRVQMRWPGDSIGKGILVKSV